VKQYAFSSCLPRSSEQRFSHVAHSRLVEIDAADKSLAEVRGDREMLEHVIGDEALIDAAESVSTSLEYGFQPGDHLRKLFQRPTAVEILRVMGNRFDAKHAFAVAPLLWIFRVSYSAA
jgi:hypothetical protein